MSLHFLGKHKPRKLCLVSHAGYLPRPPTLSDRSEILCGGWSSGDSSEVRISSKSVKWFPSCGGQNLPFAINLLIWPNQSENGQIRGKWQILTPTAPKPLNQFWRNLNLRPASWRPSAMQNFISIRRCVWSRRIPSMTEMTEKTQFPGFTFSQVVQRH